MKKTLYFVSFLFLLSSLFAQEDNSKVNEKKNSDKTSSANATGDEINFKDDANNSLIKITDEGSAGSITIPSGSTPSVTTNKLYNVGGVLKFNGNSIGSGSATDIDGLIDAKYDGESLFLGSGAGNADDGGNFNTAVGKTALSLNTSGANNTATGYQALGFNTTGADNTASGTNALYNNTTGSFNTAYGAFTLPFNTFGIKNTAIGASALLYNTNGHYNTAVGFQALLTNTTGNSNTAIGSGALYGNTDGYSNTAIGSGALYYNTTGDVNTAVGEAALYSITTGNDNTANGYYALGNNTNGVINTAIGYNALSSNTTGNYNTAIGYNAGPNYLNVALTNTTALGNNAIPTASNHVVIGNTSVTSIQGQVAMSLLSDGRFKRNIKENISGIDFIMGLRPVSFNMDYNAVSDKLGENRKFDKKDIKGTDGLTSAPSEAELKAETYMKEVRDKKSAIRQVGFIAQEVEELVNKLGVDFSGVEKPENENDMYRLRYSEFVVPLVKAVQEQQTEIKNQQTMIDELRKEVEELKSRK